MSMFGFEAGRRVVASCALGVALVAGGPANAATVSSTGPDSLINPGTGFRRIDGSEPAKLGDVVTAKKSTITVVYENGCVVEVKPGAVYAIETPESCLVGVPSLTVGNVIVGGLVAGGVAAGAVILSGSSGSGSSGTQVSPAHSDPAVTSTAVIIGGSSASSP